MHAESLRLSAAQGTSESELQHRALAPRGHRWRGFVWTAAGLVLALLRLPAFELWGDVRYTLGVERVTALAGWPSWEVWTHRPLLNRVLMAALDHLTSGRWREQELLGWSAVISGVVVGNLYGPMARRLGRSAALGLCAGLLVGLVWAPPRTLLQPEWCAVVLALAAVAVSIGRGHRLPGELALALACAGLLCAAALMKWTTVATAGAALTAIALLCRRRPQRLLRITVATAVLLPLSLGLQVLLVPHELLWIREIPRLNPPGDSLDWCTPLAAPRPGCRLQTLLLNETVTSPVLLLLPAAVVLLARAGSRPARVAAVLVPAVTIAATLATTVVQGQWFSYHVAALPVLAAGWVGWAVASTVRERGRPPWALVLLLAAAAGADVLLLMLPADVRSGGRALWAGLDAVGLAYGTGLAVAAAALVAVLLPPTWVSLAPPRRPPSRLLTALLPMTAALAVMIGQVSSVLPQTAYSLNTQSADRTATELRLQRRQEVELASRIRRRIGASSTVVYLGFGDRAYWLGNPSRCRYAAATYLQRSGYLPAGRLQGFGENLDCLADAGTSYVYIQKGWMDLDHADPRVRQAIDDNFDCDRPVLDERNTLVCARRPR